MRSAEDSRTGHSGLGALTGFVGPGPAHSAVVDGVGCRLHPLLMPAGNVGLRADLRRRLDPSGQLLLPERRRLPALLVALLQPLPVGQLPPPLRFASPLFRLRPPYDRVGRARLGGSPPDRNFFTVKCLTKIDRGLAQTGTLGLKKAKKIKN